MPSLRYLVSGPYGSGNLGDDAIALQILDQIERRGGEVSLAGIDSARFARSTGRKSGFVPRLNLRGLKLSVIRTVLKSDVIVIGGGEQFSESRVPNPLWGHLATNFQLFLIAKIFRKRFAAVGVGVSNGLSSFGSFAMRQIALGADFFSVRDEDSLLRLKALAPSANILLSADPAFLGDRFDKGEARRKLCRRFDIQSSSEIVLVIPSKDKFHSMSYLEQLNDAVRLLTRSGVEVIYAVSDSQDGYDSDLFKMGLLHTSDKARWVPPDSVSLCEQIELIAGVDCLVSSRMHPLIFASGQMTPFVCLSRAGKMEALMNLLGEEGYLKLDFTSEQLVDLVRTKMSNGVPESDYASVGRAQALALAQFESLAELGLK